MKLLAITVSAAAAVALCPQASAQWWNPLSPDDYEQCAEQAAKDGKTPQGLGILLKACQDKFQARRDPSGKGYRYYDARLQQWFKVDGPTLKQSEKQRFEQAYHEHRERIRQQEAERQERERHDAAKSERERRQYEARMEQEQRAYFARVQVALQGIKMTSQSLDCQSSSCFHKIGTVTLKNGSSETVTKVQLGWILFPASTKEQSCPTEYETKKSVDLAMLPGQSATFTFETQDRPWGPYSYCLQITSIEIHR